MEPKEIHTPIYLDYNSTTPVAEEVLEAMLPFFRRSYGNASSSTHPFGWEAAEAVKRSRKILADALGCLDQEIYFTSGATEGINLALKGIAERYSSKGDHIITVQTEHKAVLDVCKRLESQGKQITYLPVDEYGMIDLEVLRECITERTILICVMLANNETGVIQPLSEIANIAHEHGVICMTDATQAVGKVPTNVDTLGMDVLVCSGHKLYGPKGIGVIYLRRKNPRVSVLPLIEGGGHERGVRSGTLNVPGIVGMAKAVEYCIHDMDSESTRLGVLRDHLESELLTMPEVFRNGHREARLSHVSNLTFGYVDSQALINAMRHVAVSTGSACTSATMEPSHVLKAMGMQDQQAYGSVRFSLGRFTTKPEIDYAIEHVREGVHKLREKSPQWQLKHA